MRAVGGMHAVQLVEWGYTRSPRVSAPHMHKHEPKHQSPYQSPTPQIPHPPPRHAARRRGGQCRGVRSDVVHKNSPRRTRHLASRDGSESGGNRCRLTKFAPCATHMGGVRVGGGSMPCSSCCTAWKRGPLPGACVPEAARQNERTEPLSPTPARTPPKLKADLCGWEGATMTHNQGGSSLSAPTKCHGRNEVVTFLHDTRSRP